MQLASSEVVFLGGSWAEHYADANPDVTLIVTLDAAVDFVACPSILIAVDPDGPV